MAALRARSLGRPFFGTDKLRGGRAPTLHPTLLHVRLLEGIIQ